VPLTLISISKSLMVEHPSFNRVCGSTISGLLMKEMKSATRPTAATTSILLIKTILYGRRLQKGKEHLCRPYSTVFIDRIEGRRITTLAFFPQVLYFLFYVKDLWNKKARDISYASSATKAPTDRHGRTHLLDHFSVCGCVRPCLWWVRWRSVGGCGNLSSLHVKRSQSGPEV